VDNRLITFLGLCIFASAPLNSQDPDSPQEIGEQVVTTDTDTVITTTNPLFAAIAQADVQLVRTLLDDTNVNIPFAQETEWKSAFYAPIPHAGDTPVLYALRVTHLLYDNHIVYHTFNDPHSFQAAFANRLEIYRLLLFHPECKFDQANAQGVTPLSYAIKENFNPAWIHERMRMEQGSGFERQLALYEQRVESFEIAEKTKEAIRQVIKQAKVSERYDIGRYQELLKTIFDLPWDQTSTTNPSIKEVAACLDEDHYGMTKIKEKVVDFLAVRQLNPHAKGKILCLVGPPGIGKTSIAHSIARGLGKAFAKISLGAAHDPAQLRGTERVYIGAHPGQIIKNLILTKTKDPVFLLDEVDKLGHHGNHGDPASVLLEILDPAQNDTFVDRYIDIPFPLDQIFFILTANDVRQIPLALRDRLEIIELNGYAEPEKLEIAKKYLAPRALTSAGLADKGFQFTDTLLLQIIRSYTFEAGVRDLARHIQTLCAKIARHYVTTNELLVINQSDLATYLGKPNDHDFVYNKVNRVGVANGLGVVVGIQGCTATIETTIVPNAKGTIKITSQFGKKYAQDSALVAVSYALAHATELGIASSHINSSDIIIHVPAGPIDGPSAGIALLSSIVSALNGKKVDASFAMTGELSLTGRVLPVGGVRDKLLAAKKVGITKVIIPKANASELEEEKALFEGMTVIPVTEAQEVLNLVLVN
jgi:ATP-dependent Lon protease